MQPSLGTSLPLDAIGQSTQANSQISTRLGDLGHTLTK